MERLNRWFAEGHTPVMWVAGAASCGKTAAVEAVLQHGARRAVVLRLDAFDPDRVLTEAVIDEQHERLTRKRLLQFPLNECVVVLDGIDAIQQHAGPSPEDISDCRFRQLLLAACGRALPGAKIVVTSRLGPPSQLPDKSLTVVELKHASDIKAPLLPEIGTRERHVLEFAALSRRAIDSPAVQSVSGIEEDVAERLLNSLAGAGLIKPVGRQSYQVPDWIRSSVLSDATRTKAVRESAIDALRQDESDPEGLLNLLVDDGRVPDAVEVYWNDLGNFSRLHYEGRNHFGARVCRRLNNGLGPEEVSPALASSGGAWAVMNDWSQFALFCGDALTSRLAAVSAHDVLPQNCPPWDAALLAAHAAQGSLLTGDLFDAMRWCERSWEHARRGLRATGGSATREIMDAYDWSANTITKIYLRLGEASEIRRLIDDLADIHAQARESVAEFNAGSILPISGPSGKVMPEQLVEGRLAAMLALAEGEFDRVRTLAEAEVGAVARKELDLLLLRAEIAAGRGAEADAQLSRLRGSAERHDDCAPECELAVLAQARIDDATERLGLAEAYLPRAEACGLEMHWRDLQLARARALCDLDRRDEACDAAESALLGARNATGAHTSGDWVVAREAAGLLNALGRPASGEILDVLESGAPPQRNSPPKRVERRVPASIEQGWPARLDMHEAALRVLQAYEADGTPFALFFRRFRVEVLHGPFDLGPKLIENALRDGLPPEVEVVTIQDQSSNTYDLGSSRLRREAPALLLGNEQWAEIVRGLIPFADLIVSEPLMLTSGVRLELQMIYDARRWDRTVLVLPPQESGFAAIDHDDLVQMFPRCLWADSLHQEPLLQSPVITDLLERVRTIARLPADERRALRDSRARDAAFPIDLGPVAEYLERQAEIGSIFGGADLFTRYYAFWQIFRAAGIRAGQYERGDRSAANRCRLAHSYLEMGKLMLDHSTEGERSILHGDPAEAQMLVKSAYGLLQKITDDMWAAVLRAQAERQWEELLQVQQVVSVNPDRFEIRPRYGPLVKKTIKE